MKKVILFVFLCMLAFIPSVNAKTYTDKNLEIRFSIPEDWEIMGISDMQRYLSENNFPKTTVDTIQGQINKFLEYNSNFLILPDPSNTQNVSFLAVFRRLFENKEGYSLEEFAKYNMEELENGTGLEFTMYKNSKASYLFTTYEVGGGFNDKYLTLSNNNIYVIVYAYDDSSTRYLTNKEVENFIDTIEYGITSNNNSQSSNEDKIDDSSKENHDSNGYYSKVESNAGEIAKVKSSGISFFGFIALLIIATVLTIDMNLLRRKDNLPIKISLGWLGIIIQLSNLFIIDPLFFTADKVEIFYLIDYFIIGVVGLGLIVRD